jgi:dihydroxyacetone kinase-like protein
VRNYVGNYCTSLEMAGCSLTLLKLDKEIEELLAAPADIAVRVF